MKLRCFSIILLIYILANSVSAQEYIYPNKLLADQGLIEYRPYTLEETRAYETGSFIADPPFLTDWGPERQLTEQEAVYTVKAITKGDTILCTNASVIGIHAFFIRSTNAGSTWRDYSALGDSLPQRAYDFPELAVDASNLILGAKVWNFTLMRSYIGYFKSSDMGISWGPLLTVFPNYRDNQSNYASLTNSGETLYFAYNEYDHDSLYVVRSTNWGNTWNGRGNNVAYLSSTLQNMCLRASGDYLHLVWVNEEGTINVRYSRSTDQGLTWSPEIDIAEDSRGAQFPYVAVQDSHVTVSWMGYKYSSHGFTGDIFVKQSFDNGVTWDTSQVLTDLHFVSRGMVHVEDSLIVAVWQDQRYVDSLSNSEIFYRMSTDNGQSWAAEERVSFGYRDSFAPTSASTGNVIHVFWGDYRDEGPGLYYRANDFLSSIDNNNLGLSPDEFSLSAYPNPFNSATTITLSGIDNAEIEIYDITGRIITTLRASHSRALWDASAYSSGLYFVRVAGERHAATKLVLVK